MAELTQIVNGEYIGADKYTITDTSDGKKQIVFSPDSVLKQGTPVGAEILNEIQKNGLYYLDGTHRVSGQESIYDCTLVGIDTFEFTQLNVLFKPDTIPTKATVKLNISGQVFTLTEKIINANQIGLLLVKSEMKAYTWGTKISIVNDLTTGGADTALSAEMGKILNRDKFNTRTNTYGSTDLNTLIKDGMWLGYQWLNIPYSDIAVVDVKSYSNDWLVQMFYPIDNRDNARIFIRKYYNGQKWGVWSEILTNTTPKFYRIAGLDNYEYIQTPGQKLAGKGYIDNATNKVYIAKVTNSDTSVTANFKLATNIDLALREDSYKSIGVDQRWYNVTSQRAKNTLYTNDTGRPIMVLISTTSDGKLDIFVDNLMIASLVKSDNDFPFSFIVPTNSTYKITGTSGPSIWSELR